MFKHSFKELTDKDKTEAVKLIIEDSTPTGEFFLMVTLSILVATFGVLLNSTPVVIGSMLIAPLLSPILGIGLGIVMADRVLIARAFFTLSKAFLLSVVAAFVVAALFLQQADVVQGMNTEILSRVEPSILFACVAALSGVAASFALAKPRMSAALPGIAISVSLIPPVAVMGIGIAQLNWHLIGGAFLTFLVNVVSIVFASLVVFSMMSLYRKQPLARHVAEKEDEELQKIQEKENESPR